MGPEFKSDIAVAAKSLEPSQSLSDLEQPSSHEQLQSLLGSRPELSSGTSFKTIPGSNWSLRGISTKSSELSLKRIDGDKLELSFVEEEITEKNRYGLGDKNVTESIVIEVSSQGEVSGKLLVSNQSNGRETNSEQNLSQSDCNYYVRQAFRKLSESLEQRKRPQMEGIVKIRDNKKVT